jgi:acyl-CoA synthetase
MQTTPQQRIDEFTQAGWWGEETLYDFFLAAAKRPDHLALVDPANRSAITDGEPQRFSYKQLGECIDFLSDLFFQASKKMIKSLCSYQTLLNCPSPTWHWHG